jgi:signal-transduction protein with cAMP-binding, CBS, and nucleotidyltransferase domain
MPHRNVSEVIEGHRIVSMPAGAGVREAARRMTTEHVASVVVTDETAHIVGIFTERDLTSRVVAAGLDPEKTTLKQVMSATPLTIGPEATVADALRSMHLNNLRHLPVLVDGQVVGVVSMRDFVGAEVAAVEGQCQTMDCLTEIM